MNVTNIVDTVSVMEIMQKLQVSRQYIYINIFPHVAPLPRENNGSAVAVDKQELLTWLRQNSLFQRQTVRIYKEDAADYKAKLRASGGNLPADMPLSATKRGLLPFQPVKPFDYWDKKLIFPNDSQYKQIELCYRAMFNAGAVKINLGQRKTMFYVPENQPPEDASVLMPAMPETKVTIPAWAKDPQDEKKIIINAKGDPQGIGKLIEMVQREYGRVEIKKQGDKMVRIDAYAGE